MIRFVAISIAALSFAGTAIAETLEEAYPAEPDPLVGDWSGRWTEGETVDPELNAQIYALGDGKYFIRAAAKLDIRAPEKFAVEVARDAEGLTFDTRSIWGKVRGTVFEGGRTNGKGAFRMEKVTRLSPTLGKAAPAGAIVLFDGTNFDAWQSAKGWEIAEGGIAMVTPKGGYLDSKQKFTDLEMHIEFRTPSMPTERGQGRGNSGVFVQTVYEVQVLDSYGLDGVYDECGALYKLAAPMVNACAPPLQWQTYDIVYRAPRFDAAGKLLENGRMTVHHNGVLIHNDQELKWITAWTEEERHGAPPREPGVIRLQGHNNYVQFRNVWVVDKSK